MSERTEKAVKTLSTLAALVLTDDGNGGLMADGKKIPGASINYGTGLIKIPTAPLAGSISVPEYSDFALTDGQSYYSGVSASRNTLDVAIVPPKTAVVSLVKSAATRAITEIITTGQNTFDVLQNISWPRMALLDSWVFDINGKRTVERDGVLYQDWDITKGEGKIVGRLNPFSGLVTLTGIPTAAAPNIKVLQGVYCNGDYEVKQFYGHVAAAPVKPQSFIPYAETGGGDTLVGASNETGLISGDLGGNIDMVSGFFKIEADKPIPPDSLRYNAVSQSSIPLDSSIIGIDAVRLPPDGRVPIYRKGDMIVIGNRQKHGLGSAHTAKQTVSLGRADIDRAAIVDAAGVPVDAAKYSVNLKDGTLTWADPLDLSAYTLPLTAHTAQEEENRIVGVDISGSLKLQFPVSRAYPKDGTYVSSALIGGDLLVRATEPFSMQSWGKKWLDEPDADPILAKLNVKDYPIKLTSAGAITERWLIVFDNDSQFKLYGERLGMVAQGDRLNDLAPVNPATNKPYFVLPSFAFGGGWSAQSCVRFNTFGTPLPVWILRAIQPSPTAQTGKDGFTGCLRGNTIDA